MYLTNSVLKNFLILENSLRFTAYVVLLFSIIYRIDYIVEFNPIQPYIVALAKLIL
ncbi:hypothetical protein [Psychromonas hadalis]|uniref:hypothetical protein n=1 Tax=Psychromonas hadalis TaxID=211669 RepID=UPI0003B42B5A|nr:hypothetical protein [Psychromonas hadalis]